MATLPDLLRTRFKSSESPRCFSYSTLPQPWDWSSLPWLASSLAWPCSRPRPKKMTTLIVKKIVKTMCAVGSHLSPRPRQDPIVNDSFLRPTWPEPTLELIKPFFGYEFECPLLWLHNLQPFFCVSTWQANVNFTVCSCCVYRRRRWIRNPNGRSPRWLRIVRNETNCDVFSGQTWVRPWRMRRRN